MTAEDRLKIVKNYAVTDYCPAELIEYIKKMISIYGDHPQETAVRNMRREVVV